MRLLALFLFVCFLGLSAAQCPDVAEIDPSADLRETPLNNCPGFQGCYETGDCDCAEQVFEPCLGFMGCTTEEKPAVHEAICTNIQNDNIGVGVATGADSTATTAAPCTDIQAATYELIGCMLPLRSQNATYLAQYCACLNNITAHYDECVWEGVMQNVANVSPLDPALPTACASCYDLTLQQQEGVGKTFFACDYSNETALEEAMCGDTTLCKEYYAFSRETDQNTAGCLYAFGVDVTGMASSGSTPLVFTPTIEQCDLCDTTTDCNPCMAYLDEAEDTWAIGSGCWRDTTEDTIDLYCEDSFCQTQLSTLYDNLRLRDECVGQFLRPERGTHVPMTSEVEEIVDACEIPDQYRSTVYSSGVEDMVIGAASVCRSGDFAVCYGRGTCSEGKCTCGATVYGRYCELMSPPSVVMSELTVDMSLDDFTESERALLRIAFRDYVGESDIDRVVIHDYYTTEADGRRLLDSYTTVEMMVYSDDPGATVAAMSGGGSLSYSGAAVVSYGITTEDDPVVYETTDSDSYIDAASTVSTHVALMSVLVSLSVALTLAF